MSLDPHLEKYINSEGYKLVELIEVFDISEKLSRADNLNSIEYPPITNIGEISEFSESKRNYAGEIIDHRLHKNSKEYYLNEDNFQQLNRITSALLKNKWIHSKTTKEYLASQIIDWTFKTFIISQAELSLSEYLLQSLAASIKEFEISMPILNMTLDSSFLIGGVEFSYYSEAEISKWEQIISSEEPNISSKPYENFRSELLGIVYARYKCSAELSKAKELASKAISFAIDILKITSETVFHPDYPLYFDIDHKLGYNAVNKLIHVETSTPYLLKFNSYRQATPTHFSDNLFKPMEILHLSIFVNFFTDEKDKPNELRDVIMRSISHFADALTKIDQHERLVDLFTIIESLLVIDNSALLNDTVCKYCPRLVTKNINDRKQIVDVLKRLYSFRSAYIHHAKKNSFEVKDLSILQRVVNALLISLINKSNEYNELGFILKEIDDALLNAG